MLYFSEIRGKKVITEKGNLVGKLEDLVFLALEVPLITKLVIRSPEKKELIVPWKYLQYVNEEIKITHDFETTSLASNEVFIRKNLLDKQIIDIKGSKVIRVNDVVIQDKGGTNYYIAGVDIGLRGILRRLKLKKYALPIYRFFHSQTHPHYLSWADIQPLEILKGNIQLKKAQENLAKMRAEDLADYLEATTIKNAHNILDILEEKQAAEVLGELNFNYQLAIFSSFSPEKAAKILALVDIDEAVDLLFSQKEERRKKILSLLPSEKKKELEYLLSLSSTPIGSLVTTEFFTAAPWETAGLVLKRIKNTTTNFSSLYYVYVINPEGYLVGCFSLHCLLLQNQDAVVHNFMTQNVIVIHLTTPREIALRKMLKYKLTALPVITKEKKVLGIITFDDLAETLLK